MRQPNPYHPGFNQPPTVMAGRDALLGDVEEALEVAALDHRTPRPLVLVGSRGVGKTVTLESIAVLAGRKFSWPAVHVEAAPQGFLRTLTTRLLETAQLLAGEAPRAQKSPRRVRVAGGKITAGGFGVGGEVHLESVAEQLTPTELLDAALTYTLELAVERDTGLVITLDEAHTADRDELGALATALQERVPEGLPLVVVLAGLPSLRTNRGKNKLPTYLERAEWHELGPLEPEDAEHALTGPADQSGRPMDHAAAQALLSLCGGYPYAIQVAGHYAWRASSGAQQITAEHAEKAAPRIQADLEQLFVGRWEDASRREQEYLQALARVADEGTPTGGTVAAELEEPTAQVSYLRERLIKKGTIYADGAGVLHFITPGMGEWIRRVHDEPRGPRT